MTKREACDYLGISPRTLNERVKEGKLPCRYVTGRNGREARFLASDLERLRRDMQTPVMRADLVAAANDSQSDLGPLLFDAEGKPEPVDRILALAETLRIGEAIGIPRRDVLAWHRAAALAAALRPPVVKPWLTLDEAAEYSGLPKSYLLRIAPASALNVGSEKHRVWRFNREAMAK